MKFHLKSKWHEFRITLAALSGGNYKTPQTFRKSVFDNKLDRFQGECATENVFDSQLT